MLSYAPYDPSGISYYSIPSLTFHDGSKLSVRVAYRSFNANSSKVVCVPTSEHGHINTTLNFASGALKDYHVVVVAMLGNGESSSSSNTADFPQPQYQDCINAYNELFTKHLGVHELEAVVGFGMGGQQAYYWMCIRPGFVKNAVVVCSSARTSAYNHMLLDATEAALLCSVGYEMGKSKQQDTVSQKGMHAYGKVTCAPSLSAAWFRDEVFRTVLGLKNIGQFMEQWERLYDDWSATDLLALVRMWQCGNVGTLRADGDYAKALEDIETRVLVIASTTDIYFSWVLFSVIDFRSLPVYTVTDTDDNTRLQDAEIEIKHLKRGELAILDTIWGHIAGSGTNKEDTVWMDKTIAEFLRRG
jgi:homoserine acetyltransferase